MTIFTNLITFSLDYVLSDIVWRKLMLVTITRVYNAFLYFVFIVGR